MPELESFLSASFKQMDPIGRLFPNDSNVKGGVCFALSTLWMRRHKDYKSEGPQKRIDFLGDDDTIYHAAILQRLYGAEYVDDAAGGHDRAQGVAMGYRGMSYNARKYEDFVRFSDEPSDTDVAEMLNGINNTANRTHEYTMVSFSFKGGGGHATCCYKSGGKLLGIGSHLYAFDPNFGEYKVDGGQVKTFYRTLFSRYHNYRGKDGKLNRHTINQVTIRGVNVGNVV
ncbi:MAG: hypothetical protein FJX54_16530 [Alphaproteobacteria bacterium]|nr:hypothetical protein [Alphaproteobacteria bacterium]